MIDVKGDLFDAIGRVDAICITTNGYVKANGECVMGRGCARTAKQKWPELPKILGVALQHNGNHSVLLMTTEEGTEIWSFPVKHNWWESADIELIERSAKEIAKVALIKGWKWVMLPRPGCGNGKLDYKDVRPVIEKILDDRFLVVTF